MFSHVIITTRLENEITGSGTDLGLNLKSRSIPACTNLSVDQATASQQALRECMPLHIMAGWMNPCLDSGFSPASW